MHLPKIKVFSDKRIRQNGFRIWVRLSGKEPQWLKDGELYTESEVYQYIIRKESGEDRNKRQEGKRT